MSDQLQQARPITAERIENIRKALKQGLPVHPDAVRDLLAALVQVQQERDEFESRAWKVETQRDHYVQLHAEAERLVGQYREALEAVLDCRGAYKGLVSDLGGEPAICTKCEDMVRRVLFTHNHPGGSE